MSLLVILILMSRSHSIQISGKTKSRNSRKDFKTKLILTISSGERNTWIVKTGDIQLLFIVRPLELKY
jgi:hypothetical protein